MEKEKNKISIILNLSKTEISIFLSVGILLVFMPLLFTWSNISWISFKETGTIGDTIGGITAPFIGFGGSILVYLALKAQIDANNKIQQQFDEQKKIDYKQNFENTFFNMLTIHHDIVKNIDFNVQRIYENDEYLRYYCFQKEINKNGGILFYDKNDLLRSRDVFQFSLEILCSLLLDDLIFGNNIPDEYYVGDKENDKSNIEPLYLQIDHQKSSIVFNNISKETSFQFIYDSIYFKLNTDFGHYFRNVYRIIKMVDEKKFSDNPVEDYKIKYSYTSIVRAQLSDDEIVWLFFNCLSNKGSEKFKPLLEKYSMLKIINDDDDTYNFYSKFYEHSAFEKPEDENLEEHVKKFKV